GCVTLLLPYLSGAKFSQIVQERIIMDLLDDEEGPPTLQDMADQVSALRIKPAGKTLPASRLERSDLQDATLEALGPSQHAFSMASASESKPAVSRTKLGKGSTLKGGFLNAKSRPQGRKPTESLTHVAAKPHASRVPQGFMLEPSQDEQQYSKFKTKLIDYLKPTPESMEQVMGNGQLMAGFDDPEVMEAVNAIAQSPGAIQKYKSNAKVMRFYQSMGQMMATRCEDLAKT
ncbi:hypothetical protein WJX84_000844, partial [Apatococcus fuscideae]